MTQPRRQAEREEAMSPYFALFNCHLNRADVRACRAFKERFGPEAFAKHIQPRRKEGIMSIFQRPANRWTRWFVAKVTEIVNENRLPSPQREEPRDE